MKNPVMTWRELRKMLQEMPEERLDDTAAVYLNDKDKYFGVEQIKIEKADGGSLDKGHSAMVIDDNFFSW